VNFPNKHSLILATILILYSCAKNNVSSPQPQQIIPTSSLMPLKDNTLPQLFKDAPQPENYIENEPHITRSRFVYLNTELFLIPNGKILELEPGTLLTINLFPEISFIGVIERGEQNGPDSHSWVGRLKDIEYSSMYIVFTEGVFLIHIASPSGIYEVHLIENDLYQVIEIDQSQSHEE
jgi:hypothetical protein